VTNHAGLPSEVEPTSIADLVADAFAVKRVLHVGGSTVTLPDPRGVVIPDGALAAVAGLDTYGD
jgi:hypothetical protein